jgi:hypothetical protein
MTIAVACNLADGIVLGSDSAITILGAVRTPQGDREGVLKVYNDGEKLFPLYKLPIGIVTYGLAQLKQRTIESYIREFEHTQNKGDLAEGSVKDIANELWKFFHQKYQEAFAAALEQKAGIPFDEVDASIRPKLGFIIGGFSHSEYLSEMWEVTVHSGSIDDGVQQIRAPGKFGANWRGEIGGVRRFHKGFSFGYLDAVIKAILEHHDVQMTDELRQKIQSIIDQAEYAIPWEGMPLQEGIDYVKFCLDIMINQTKFVVGAPTCGGNVRIAVIQRDEGFHFVTDTGFAVRTL